MKNLIQGFSVIFIFLLLNSSLILSQTIDNGEFMFVNRSNHQISVKIYPNGAIFNGNNEYNLTAFHRISSQEEHKYIYPLGPNPIILNPYGTGIYLKRANFDRDWNNSYCDFSLGFGKYRIEIDDYTNPVFAFDIDFSDADFCGSNPDYYRRIRIDYYLNSNITYNFIDNDGVTNFSLVAISSESVINVWELQGTPHQGWFTQSKGDFTEAIDVPEFLTWPLIATGEYQAMGHLNSEQIYLNLRIANHNITLNAVNQDYPVKFENCKFTVDEYKILTINGGQNSYPHVIISGTEGKLSTKSNSQINFPKDCCIEIFNNAIIDAFGTEFVSDNPEDGWSGFKLNQAGSSTYNGCTFNRIASPISAEGNGNNLIDIRNNTFNFPEWAAIYLIKQYNVFIISNHFWLTEGASTFPNGIGMITTENSESENNSINPSQNINVIDNDFHGGAGHLFLDGLGNPLQAYIRGNYFENARCNIQLFFNCSGTILSNSFNNQREGGNCLELFINCNADIKSNYFNSISTNIDSRDASRPNLAPLQIEDQYIWTGGYNSLYSSSSYNIYSSFLGIPGFVYTDYGRNYFLLNNSNQYFINAKLNTTSTTYDSRNNCWYINNGPVDPSGFVSLWNSENPPECMTINYQSQPPMSCDIWDQIVDRIITNRGNGIFDTIFITQSNNLPFQSNDAAVYSSGVKNQKLKNYTSAISNFKNLINNYSNSIHLERAILNLYECYIVLDTIHNQGWRNIIFGDLKNYLEAKIQQYDTNETFVNVAFDFVLKSKVKIKSYMPALDGYEFITENSPSAIKRLMASINYIDVEGLLQGGSGGQKDIEAEVENLSEKQNPNPIKDILLASYKKIKNSIEQKEKFDIQNSNDVKRTKSEQAKKHSFDKKLENRARENIKISSTLTKEERRERIQNDLLLLHQRNDFSEPMIKKNDVEQIKYELSQNYPNPFNPVTYIKYQIQKTGLVTLKIYDITGRVIKTLLNEIKNPGVYIVTFNGSELASGMYFYRIQAGNFVNTKKMVILK